MDQFSVALASLGRRSMTVTYKRTGEQAMYDVAGLYVSRGFVAGDSVFTPGISVWTETNFQELVRLFVDRPDAGSGDYLRKLSAQMEEAEDAQKQLMAELHLLYFLPSMQVGPKRRREIVETILSWMNTPVVVPDDVDPGFGVAHIRPGTYWATRRDVHIGYLIRFGVVWFEDFRTPEDRKAVVDDPWLLKEVLNSIPDRGASAQRELLLHLTHPAIFEPISKVGDKRLIIERWPEFIGEASDIDRQLVEVRKHLTAQFGDDFDYYAPGTREIWGVQPKKQVLPAPAASPVAPDPRVVVVYLTDVSSRNFDHGARDGIWAFKRQPDGDNAPRVGDKVIFVFKAKNGPRQQLDQFVQQPVERVVTATASSDLYVTAESYWPDESPGDVKYPFQFRFAIERDQQDVNALSGPISDIRVMQAAKTSASGGGSPVLLADGLLSTQNVPIATFEPVPIAQLTSDFSEAAAVSGLDWGTDHDTLTASLIVSLMTKRFVILSGLSGSGKTRLAIALGQWLGGARLKVVPVRPDWTSPDATMGYRDGLESATTGSEKWFVPEVLEFVLTAMHDSAQPYILVLDEMNLAHVERYFAEMLSGIESGQAVVPNLVKTNQGWQRADEAAVVPWPINLFLIGTVNVDETTYAFSPKVLDRANTLEFRVSTDSLRSSGSILAVEPAADGWSESFLAHSHAVTDDDDSEVFQEKLKALHALLSRHGFEFGHRVYQEAIRFRGFAKEAWQIADDSMILDLQMMQKVLPRVHGAQRRVQTLLEELQAFTLGTEGADLPRSHAKVTRMLDLLRANHFVAFTD